VKHALTNDDLWKKLDLIIKALERYANGYDEDFKKDKHNADNEYFFAMSAVLLRVLLHDTTRGSKSLLEQLGIKQKIKFLDTEFDSSKGVSNCIFTQENTSFPVGYPRRIQISSNGFNTGLCSKNFELIDESQRITFTPNFMNKTLTERQKSFDDWWSAVIFKGPDIGWDEYGNAVILDDVELTREELVLNIADKEQAHVDTDKDEAIIQLERTDLLSVVINGERKPFENSPKYASLRQIVYEVVQSIKNYLPSN